MPEVGSFAFVLFVVGLVVTLGGWLVWISVLIRYRMHYSWRFAEGFKKLMASEGKADRKRAGLGCLIMAVGIPLWMVGTMIGDSQRNQPCREACEAEGYRTGRFRGSPHDVVNGRSQGEYQCWCNHTEQDWAPEPLDLPSPP